MNDVAVLFARAGSVYNTLPGVDVYDLERDARTFPGGMPVVAHPPCRLWASLRTKSKAPAEEKEHARWAMAQVRRWGGVLEHPWLSTLWDEFGLRKNRMDFWGCLWPTDLHSFGFQAKKKTGVYVVGVRPRDMPATPLVLGEATHTIGLWSGRDKANCRPSIAKSQFDSTPPLMAEWLVEVARRSNAPADSRSEGPDLQPEAARRDETEKSSEGPSLLPGDPGQDEQGESQ